MKQISYFLGMIACSFTIYAESSISEQVSPEELQKTLETDGLVGSIHGAVANTGLCVFTYRDPKNFFRFAHFPLISKDPQILSLLKSLDRHDRVKVIGEFVDNGAPKKHILAKSLVVIEKGSKEIPHEIGIPFPNDLYQMSEVKALVHIVEEKGSVLVIEYKDSVIPVFVSRPELTKNLYRNDKIKLKYKIRSYPRRPVHLELNTEESNPLEVIESLVKRHGAEETLEGTFVRFPKSDQVSFDVYALLVVDADGLKRNYTLVNFEDKEVFKKIREKLAKAWEAHKSEAVNGRNKWIVPTLRIRAKGKINVVDPGQANPQILLEGPESIQILEQAWQPVEAK